MNKIVDEGDFGTNYTFDPNFGWGDNVTNNGENP
jgi:hypothetical protein